MKYTKTVTWDQFSEQGVLESQVVETLELDSESDPVEAWDDNLSKSPFAATPGLLSPQPDVRGS